MAILFCGGEIEDFSQVGTVASLSWTTNTGFFRSAYARMCLSVAEGNWTAWRATFAASASVGITARWSPTSTFNANHFFWLTDAGDTKLRLKMTGAAPSTIILDKWDGSAFTNLATSSLTLSASVSLKLDILVTYAASGRFRLWIDGVLWIDYSGNTLSPGSTTLNGANFSAARTTSSTSYWSEIIVTDGEDPRPLMLKTLAPNAAGDTTAWTSGTYAEIDEIIADTTDLAISETANQVLAVNCTGMPTGGSGLSVRAVKSVAYACRGSTGPSKLALGVRQSSTNGFASGITLETGYGTVSTTWTTNPITSAAFTAAEIDALQLAYRSET